MFLNKFAQVLHFYIYRCKCSHVFPVIHTFIPERERERERERVSNGLDKLARQGNWEPVCILLQATGCVFVFGGTNWWLCGGNFALVQLFDSKVALLDVVLDGIVSLCSLAC